MLSVLVHRFVGEKNAEIDSCGTVLSQNFPLNFHLKASVESGFLIYPGTKLFIPIQPWWLSGIMNSKFK